jgi:peptide deformylase
MEKVKKITIEDNEEFLRQVSKPVIFPDKELEDNIKLLEQFFTESDTTLALAAVQIGIPKRLIYLKNTDLEVINRKNNDQETEEDRQHNEQRILINPVIISREGLTEYWEACASCLDNMGYLYRPYKVVIKYNDIEGNELSRTFEGFPAVVFCHEYDHLDGILHMDKALECYDMEPEAREVFRETHKYDVFEKEGSYEELNIKYRKNYE